jgi:hypothetical protein
MTSRSSKHSGRIEVGQGKKVLAGLRFAWRRAFEAACKHDGIPGDAKFVEFSDDNPYRQFVDRAAQTYFETIREYQAGGYVGLTMTP